MEVEFPTKVADIFKPRGGTLHTAVFTLLGNPFNKIAAVLVLNCKHLFSNFFHRHATTKDGSHCKISDRGEDHKLPSWFWHQNIC
jgi:hypothetical protein